MKLYSIEGNRQKLDGGAMFGNAPRAVWQSWCAPDDKNRIDLACRALLLQTDAGQNVLCEAGIGQFFPPKLKERYGVHESGHQLLLNLQKVGVQPNEIDAVILSHLHFDHAGGLLSAYAEDTPFCLVFPKARFYVGAAHWQRAQQPHSRDQASFVPELNRLLQDSGRLVLVDDTHPQSDFPEIDFRFSDGHTVGLMHAVIRHPQGPIAFASDLIPGLPWVHLPITMGYDRFPERLIEEKKRLLEELVAKQGFLFLTHDPQVPLARVQQKPTGQFEGLPENQLLEKI